MLLHQNLCDHGDDVGQLYKIWDDDLKNTHRKMEYWRYFAMSCFVVALPASPSKSVGCAVSTLYRVTGRASIPGVPATTARTFVRCAVSTPNRPPRGTPIPCPTMVAITVTVTVAVAVAWRWRW